MKTRGNPKNMESKRDVSLTLNMTMNVFACAILCHCEAIAEAINRIQG